MLYKDMKFLYRPLNPFIVNQKFGENQACVSTDGKNKVIACDGINPPPGYKSLYGSRGHLGLDLGAKHGQPIYCACNGYVGSIDTNPKSGLDVRIISEIEGKRYRHIYEHLLGYQPKIGDKVETGDLIGWADNTGYSAGDHLHFQFEMWDNGWFAIDPSPFMNDSFALHVSLVKRLKESVALLSDKVADWLRRPR